MTRLLLILALVFQVFCAGPLPAEEKTAEPAPKVEKKLDILEIYRLSNALPRELIDLRSEVEELKSVAALETQLPEIERIVEELTWDVNIAESMPDITYHQLAAIDTNLVKTRFKIDSLNRHVTENVNKLQGWYIRWQEYEAQIATLKSSRHVAERSGDVRETIAVLEQTVGEAKSLLEGHLLPNLIAGKKMGVIQTEVHSLGETVIDLIRDTNALMVQQTSPSMLSSEFYRRLDTRLLKQTWESVRLFFSYQKDYALQNLSLVAATGMLAAFMTLIIRLSRKLVKASSRWFVYASRPFATAILVSCVSLSLADSAFTFASLPPDWGSLVNLPLIIAVAYFADQITSVQWQNQFLRRLTLFLACTTLMTIINIPHALLYLFVFYSMAGVFIYSFCHFLKRWREAKSRTVTWAIWLWGLFPVIIISAGIAGYDQLAVLIFGRVLVMVVATMTIWILLQISCGLLEVFLLFFPLSIVRRNNETIVHQLRPTLFMLHAILWLTTMLMVFWVHPTLGAAFKALTSLQVRFASFELTPGSVLVVIFVCYLTVLVSRAIRAFLQQEVLPRYGVDKGVQVSITRLVHYAILTVGLFVLLHILGFGLNQIAILGGALSVGIGFGLQAIVNNFVSGLILLFERPIKVGDMIQIGTEVGEVKELGLRATTVQTYDNAEIVIPNSELITASVTNWTLADKRARLRVPVGVAYGTDVETVIRILLACANNNPSVLSTPKPRALFLAFGASSLDFELRVWIPNATERTDILSELNQDIESEFQMAGIEIPFPQSDLHLRSVDQGVAEIISGRRVSMGDAGKVGA